MASAGYRLNKQTHTRTVAHSLQKNGQNTKWIDDETHVEKANYHTQIKVTSLTYFISHCLHVIACTQTFSGAKSSHVT